MNHVGEFKVFIIISRSMLTLLQYIKSNLLYRLKFLEISERGDVDVVLIGLLADLSESDKLTGRILSRHETALRK